MERSREAVDIKRKDTPSFPLRVLRASVRDTSNSGSLPSPPSPSGASHFAYVYDVVTGIFGRYSVTGSRYEANQPQRRVKHPCLSQKWNLFIVKLLHYSVECIVFHYQTPVVIYKVC
jgi:hypothetical protein